MSYKEHRWHPADTPPVDGLPVVVLFKNGKNDPDFWTTDIAYFCDGGFYQLEYDPNLGVLRKQYVKNKISYWATYDIPDRSEVV